MAEEGLGDGACHDSNSPPEITVVVLTLDEERNITGCLERLMTQFKRVVVVDSGSVDGTVTLAERRGAEVLVHRQEGVYSAAQQRNWALAQVATGTDWVLFIDADERVPDGLGHAIRDCIAQHPEVHVIALPFLYHLFGGPVRSMGYPNWHDRVVHTGARFCSGVAEYVDSDRRVYLKTRPVDHHFHSIGMRRFMEKQTRYAEFVGDALYEFSLGHVGEYFAKPDGRGRAKKLFAYALLTRPIVRFLYHYILRWGVGEGVRGLALAIYMACFECLVVARVCERRAKRTGSGQPP